MKRDIAGENRKAKVQKIQELRRSNAPQPEKNKKTYNRTEKYKGKYDN